jgi:hypothetical protein
MNMIYLLEKIDWYEGFMATPLADGPSRTGRRSGSAGWLSCGALLGLVALALPGGASAAADLVVRMPVPAPGAVNAGDTYRLNVYVRNKGDDATPEGSCVKVLVRVSGYSNFGINGADANFVGNMCGDLLDTPPGDSRQCYAGVFSSEIWCKVRRLTPGEELGFTVSVRARFTGGYSVTAIADPDNRIRESSDTNNMAVIPVAVPD